MSDDVCGNKIENKTEMATKEKERVGTGRAKTKWMKRIVSRENFFFTRAILTQAADSFNFCNLNVYIFTLRGHRIFNACEPGDREEMRRKKKLLLIFFSHLCKFHFVCLCVCVCLKRISLNATGPSRVIVALEYAKDTKLSSSPKFELVLRSSGDEKGTTLCFREKNLPSFFALGTFSTVLMTQNTHDNF